MLNMRARLLFVRDDCLFLKCLNRDMNNKRKGSQTNYLGTFFWFYSIEKFCSRDILLSQLEEYHG